MSNDQVRAFLRRSRRQDIDNGQCDRCGAKRGPDGTKTRCRPCADYMSARQKEYEARKKVRQ